MTSTISPLKFHFLRVMESLPNINFSVVAIAITGSVLVVRNVLSSLLVDTKR